MPPGTVSPFVIRFDAGTLPVGYLVFSSPTTHVGRDSGPCAEPRAPAVCDAYRASRRRRLSAATSEPSSSTLIRDKLQAYGLSPEEVVQALTSGNSISRPAMPTSETDATSCHDQFDRHADRRPAQIPFQPGRGPAVYIRDIGSVADSSDILAGMRC